MQWGKSVVDHMQYRISFRPGRFTVLKKDIVIKQSLRYANRNIVVLKFIHLISVEPCAAWFGCRDCSHWIIADAEIDTTLIVGKIANPVLHFMHFIIA